MRLNRIRISQDSINKLRILKGRTGMTPNILCRLGLALSFLEPGAPEPKAYPEDGVEFNRFTLMGEWDPLIVALVKERFLEDGLEINNGNLVEYFRAHLNRGVLLLYNRAKDLSDLTGLLSNESVFPSEAD